jgi:hypothetical protein
MAHVRPVDPAYIRKSLLTPATLIPQFLDTFTQLLKKNVHQQTALTGVALLVYSIIDSRLLNSMPSWAKSGLVVEFFTVTTPIVTTQNRTEGFSI